MATEEDFAIFGLGVAAMSRNLSARRPMRRRRFWTRRWLLRRDQFSHMGLLQEIRENNPDDFRNYLRMTDPCFRHLLALVTPYIQRQDTVMRMSISPEQRLIATLRYLATGRSLQDLKFSTGISPQALGRIIPETCSALIQVLQRDYMQFPSTPQEWMDVSAMFQRQWDFPNCGGAIDGKHVRIVPPPRSGSLYYNYKGFFSIVLMAVVSANYEFLFVDVGQPGRNSDGGTIVRTEFHHRLVSGTLNLPTNMVTVEGLNFVFVADEAFALGEHLLRPFPLRQLTPDRRIFNFRLSRARRVVENAFGIMANRFRIFHTAIHLAQYKMKHVVLCCCILHNYLRKHGENYLSLAPSGDPQLAGPSQEAQGDAAGPTMSSVDSGPSRLASQRARRARDEYVDYFVGRGAIAGQHVLQDPA